MFEGVDTINWESFGECHIAVGVETTTIPHHIRNMLNEDPEEREEAIASLLGEGQHLGMLGTATPYIIPFVLEVLALPDYDKRGYLVFGLSRMFDHMFRSEVFRDLQLTVQIYQEIRKGYPLYKALLSDSDPWTRFYTAHIIAYMQDDIADALPTLIARLPLETHTNARTEIVEAILKLNTVANYAWRTEGKRITAALYDFLKEHGSLEENVKFARTMNKTLFRVMLPPDIKTFVQDTLARDDLPES